MADNVKIDEGSGPSIATDEVGGSQHQKVKVEFGENGTATEVSAANPLPVGDGGSTLSVDDGGGALTVDGTVAVSGSVAVTDNSGSLTVDDGGSSLTVDGTVAVSGEPTVKVNSALPAGANSIGTVVLGAGSAEAGKVKVTELPALPAGSNAIGQVDPRGNVAHDSADSGNPVKVGARARTALVTAVAQDDRTDNMSDKFGRLLGITAPLDQRVSGSVDITNTTTTTVIEAPGASTAIVVTDIEVSNGDESVGTFVEIYDDETKKWKGYAGAKGGGFSQHNADGLFVCTANKAVKAKCVTTSSETSVNVSGYKIPA